jgi:type II secretory pathway component PulF
MNNQQPTAQSAAAPGTTYQTPTPKFVHLSTKEQIIFARNLALMAQSGMPLLESITLLQKQSQTRSSKKILSIVKQDIESGMFLSVSLERFKNVFGSLFINILRVGEASGTLATNLDFLAVELKKKQELKGKIVSAMIYPIIIAIAALMLVGVLLFGIFPKIMPIFTSLTTPLPWTTRALIGVNSFGQAHWIGILMTLILVPIGISLLMRIQAVRYSYHKLLLSLPVVGPLMKAIQLTIIARTLGILLKSGIHIDEAISYTADIVTNLVYKRHLVSIAEKVRSGSTMSGQFELYPHIFAVMFTQMINVSENAGTLEETLKYLSDNYEEDVDESMANLVAMIEPLLMVVMGGAVAFVAMAILLPIFSISQSIGH